MAPDEGLPLAGSGGVMSVHDDPDPVSCAGSLRPAMTGRRPSTVVTSSAPGPVPSARRALLARPCRLRSGAAEGIPPGLGWPSQVVTKGAGGTSSACCALGMGGRA